MMNSNDLIVGHFEGVLTPAEASQLDELLRTSPEVRAAFEQHRAIDEGMLEDSETLVPPIGLREATLAVAFGGALTTTIGGGIAAWLSTKAAVVLSTIALGGVIVGGIVLSNDDSGEETETVISPGQLERVESVGPVGELEINDEVASGSPGNLEATTPAAAATRAPVGGDQSRSSGTSTNNDESRIDATPPPSTSGSPNGTEHDELDLSGQDNDVDMPIDSTKVKTKSP